MTVNSEGGCHIEDHCFLMFLVLMSIEARVDDLFDQPRIESVNECIMPRFNILIVPKPIFTITVYLFDL